MILRYRLERWSALSILATAALSCSKDITWIDNQDPASSDLTSTMLAESQQPETSDGNDSGEVSSADAGASGSETENDLTDAGATSSSGGSDAAPSSAAPSSAAPSDAGTSGAAPRDATPACTPGANPGLPGNINVDLTVPFQLIRGFGGINVPGWIDDLTPDEVDTAFGNGPGQIGMSLLRIRVPYDPEQFALEVPTAAHAVQLGATVIASPWTPPAALKSNGDIVGGSLLPESYSAYADHLLSFRDFMQSNGVPLYAMSVQNEPDISVTYESCSWTAQEIEAWLAEEGSRFGDTKLIAAESYNFSPAMTDPILQDPAASAPLSIVGGHLYGRRPTDYPLARSMGKELWMTEHYTDSSNPANAWPQALAVGKEIHDSMSANFSAYIWWYIRRSYGPLTEDGLVSKRGYFMAQYAKFVRPGEVRVAASAPTSPDVYVTAYKGESRVVVVAVNMSADAQDVTLDLSNGCVGSLSRFTTSETENVSDDGVVELTDGRATLTLTGQSVTTFVSR